jgi:hypothetical protein
MSVGFDKIEHMFEIDLGDLDATATLAFVDQARVDADRVATHQLIAAGHWADLHGHVEDRPGPALPGCERLIQAGGDGTPEVAEFCTAELGAVLGVSDWSARQLVADALDLRHRLPLLWGRVQAGEVKPWIARKTAQATRRLSQATCAAVDLQVAPYADRLTWARLEPVIAAAWMRIDPEAANAADQTARDELGVWVSRSSEAGTKTMFARAEAADVIRFDAAVDRCADGMELLGDDRSKDVRRAAALGVLADPQRTFDLYQEAATAAGVRLEKSPAAPRTGAVADTRPPVTLYVHLTDQTLATGTGVARVEGVGPVIADRVRDWLGNSTVTVKPVIDLANQTPVDSYEVPARLAEAVRLRSPADCFPYATSTERSGDIDHTIPYVPPDDGGPPGQTRIDGLGRMTRFHHRVKTHSHWTVKQVWSGVFVWRSPHGYCFLVDHTGTRRAA